MLCYVLKRSFYSLLIVCGVMILTFVLFHLSSGDPAAAVLGKSPSPEELEQMRESLGSNKPLFCGFWKETAMYASADLSANRTTVQGLQIRGHWKPSGQGAYLPAGSTLVFSRLFAGNGTEKIQAVIHTGAGTVFRKEYSGPPEEIRIRFPHDTTVRTVHFYKQNRHFLDSQLTAALKELICFSHEFPYISVFNFGNTLQSREPIREKLLQGMVPSLLLMLPVFFGELLLGILLGMISCICHGKFTDRVILCLSVAGMSISYLVLIIFGQWFFAYYLNLFPVWGWGDIRYLLLPVAIGILSGTGGGVRFYRTVFLDELNREYIRTARAKGLGTLKVYFKHLLKNALIPVITRASTVLPFLFTGSLLLETFFGIPGLGYAGINALNDADLQMLKALVILSALLFTFINLLTDLAYAWTDPRVRLK